MQTRFDLFMEALVNLLIGFIITVIANLFVYPAFGVIVPFHTNMGITLVFSLISVIRSYTLRRIFNGRPIWLTMKQAYLKHANRV